jgi:hypothetical protein
VKRWFVLIVGVLSLLAGCASLPVPESPEDSLVIGYFVLDFPDGFFEQNRHTFTSGVTLNFINETTGKKFWLITSEGYFQFLSNGTDSYAFESYKLETSNGSVNGGIDKKFAAKPHSVLYLGQLTLIYAKPKKTYKTSMDLKTVYWEFQNSSNFAYNEEELRGYLQGKDPQCPWLEYEVARVR